MATTVEPATRMAGVLNVIQEIQNAHSKAHGAAISPSLNSIRNSLVLVNQDEGLQNIRVTQQLETVTQVVTRLATYLKKRPGYQNDRDLQGILYQLGQAGKELRQRINGARVNLPKDKQDKQERLQGGELVFVGHHQMSQEEADGFPRIEVEDIPAPETGASEDAEDTSAPSGTRDAQIYNNKTLGNPKFMTGDIGIEKWQRVANRKTRISDNSFGHNARVLTGDIGGEAAKDFSASFWN